jgi:protein TonB
MKRLASFLIFLPLTLAAQAEPPAPAQHAPTAIQATAPAPAPPVPPITPASLVGRMNCQMFYPMHALRAGRTGQVTVTFRVGVDGATKDVRVKTASDYSELDDAAAACVAGFHYNPAQQNGHPIEVDKAVVIAFDLPRNPVPRGSAHDCRDEARAIPTSQIIIVHIFVDASGDVTGVKLPPSSDAALDGKLIACLSAWRFKPALRLGKPVDGDVLMLLEDVRQGPR